MFKRLLSLLVTVTMLVSLIPAGVFAEGDIVVTDTVEQVVVQPEPEKEEPKQEEKEPETPVEEPKEPEAAPTEEPKETETPVEEPVEEEPAQEEPVEDELLEDEEELLAEGDTEVAAFNAAVAELPQTITWDNFDSVEAAYGLLAAVPDARKTGEDIDASIAKLNAAKTELLRLYTVAAGDVATTDIWANQVAIKAFANGEMKAKIDAATYVVFDGDKPDAAIVAAMDAYEAAQASIGDVDYETLQAALNAVAAGDTIRINVDLSISEPMKAEKDVTYTINTNNKTITLANYAAITDNADFAGRSGLNITAGQVTLNGGGKFVSTDVNTKCVVIATGATTTLTIDSVEVSISGGSRSHGNQVAVIAEKVTSITVNNSKLSGKADTSYGYGLRVQGTDANNMIQLNVGSGTEITGDYAFYAMGNTSYVIDGAVVTGSMMGLSANGNPENGNVNGTVKNSTISVERNIYGTSGIYFPNTTELNVINCDVTACCAVEVKSGTVVIDGCTLRSFGENPANINGNGSNCGGDGIVIGAHKAYQSNIDVTIKNTEIISENQNAIFVARVADDTKTIKVTVDGCDLVAAEGKLPILKDNLTEEEIKAITIANSETAPALADGNYTLADGQTLIPVAGNKSVVAASMEAALKSQGTIILGADYTSPTEEYEDSNGETQTRPTEAIVIPEGTTLDAAGYTITAKSVKVEGTLTSTDNDALTTTATIVNGGKLIIDGNLIIANEVTEGTENLPVFGLREGAQMTAQRNTNGGTDYQVRNNKASPYIIVIQRGFDGSNKFALTNGDTLRIWTDAKAWVLGEITVDMTGIRGTLSYPVVAIGDAIYDGLKDAMTAVKDGETITVLKDHTVSGGARAFTRTGTADNPYANFTIDTQGHTITFSGYTSTSWTTSYGLGITRGVVTLTGGGKLVGTDGTAKSIVYVAKETPTQADPPGELIIDGVDISISGGSAEQAAVYVDDGGTITLKKTNISAHNTAGEASGVRLESGSDALMANVKAEPANQYDVKIDGDYGVFAVKNANYTLDGVDITAKRMGITGNGNTGNGNTIGNVANSRIVVEGSENVTIGAYMPSTGTLSISSSTIKAESGVEVKSGTVTIDGCTIEATGETAASINSNGGGGGDAIAVYGNSAYQGTAIDVTIKDTTVTSNHQNAIYVERVAGDTKTITVKVEGSELNAAEGKLPIKAVNLTAEEIAAITVAETTTSPMLEAGNYTLAQGQTLIPVAGDTSVVTTSLEDLLTKDTTVTLGADYEDANADVVIPVGTTLDAAGFALNVKSVKVEGELTSTNNDALAATDKTTVVNGGILTINGVQLVANQVTEAAEGAAVPVFGLTEGAVMTVWQNEQGGTCYQATTGEIYIQRAFGEGNEFAVTGEDKLFIPTTDGGVVWLTNGITLGSKANIFGRIRVRLAQIGEGEDAVIYGTLEDAIKASQGEDVIKILLDVTGAYAIDEAITIDKAVTIDLDGKTIDFELSKSVKAGFDIKNGAVVTIKNGTLSSTIAAGTNDDGADGKIATIVASEGADVTLDGVTTSVTGGAQKIGKAIRVNGATVSAINQCVLDSAFRTVLVEADGLFKANNCTISTNGQLTLKALGTEGHVATMELTDCTVTGDYCIQPSSYSKVVITNTNVTGKAGTLFGNGLEKSAEIVVTGGTFTATNEDTCAVYIPSTKSLTMTGTTINSTCVGIEIKAGENTLKDVTINAGKNIDKVENGYDRSGGTSGSGDAIVVIANTNYGDKDVKLTVDGGTYTSELGNALTFGYASNATAANRTLTVEVNNATLSGGKNAIYHHGAVEGTVTVSDINTKPQLDKNNVTLAQGQTLIDVDYDPITGSNDATITRAKLSDAINARAVDYARITLPMSYINREDDIVVTSKMTLFVQGEGTVLDVNSVKIYHELGLSEGASLRANELEAIRNPDSDEGGLLNLRNIGQLLDNTTVVVKSNVDKYGTMGSGMLQIGSKYVISSLTGGYVGLFKPGRGAEMRVSARNVGTTEAPQYVANYEVIAGEVTIANNGQATFDIGDDYLTISDDAIVTLGDGVGMTAISEHITGTITTPDIAVLKALLAAFDKAPAEVTYEDYKTVKAILAARDEVLANGRQALAQTEFEEVKAYEDTYLIRYVLTAPKLLTLKADTNLVEIGGAGVVFTVEYDTLLPDDVEQCAKDNFDIICGFNAGARFAVETATKTVTTDGAEANNVGTLSARLVQKTDPSSTAAATAEMLFRAIPNSQAVTLKEVVLASYNEVVNLKYSSQDLTIPVMYAFDNEMSYDLRGYKVTGVTWADGTDKTPIKDVYGIVFDPADPDHVTLEAIVENGALKIAKNKTYTGNLVFTVTDANDQPVQVPATALLSVKVTDVAPKVTVKLGTLDVFLNEVNSASGDYQYSYNPVAVTFGGANVDDIETINFDKEPADANVKYNYNKEDGTIEITSKEPLAKGTLKPVMTVVFTDASHFAPIDLAKASKTGLTGTVSLKVTETSPAIKLDKSSLTVSGTKDATVDVSVIATNKKAPFDLSTISGVEALEVIKTTSTPHPYVSAALAGDEGTVTLTVTEGFSQLKNTKVTLRFAFDDTDKTKDLVVTLNVKTTAIKLGKSSADMNILSADKVARIPVTVTPQTDAAVLEKITVTVSKTETNEYEPVNDVIDVEGMLFSIEDGNTLVVDGENATLVKGSLKYNLFFAGATKSIAFTVKVAEKFQTVKLGKSSVSVNTTLNDYASVPIVYSDGNLDDSQLTVDCSDAIVWHYDQYAGELLVGYVDAENAQNSEKLTITIADANLAPKKDVLTLTVKKVVKPVVMKVSIKGSLDTLTDNSMVAATVSFSGTTGGYNMKTFAEDQNLDVNNFTLTDPTNALEIKDSEYDAKGNLVLYIGWAAGANLKGAGKYNVGISMYDSASDLDIKLAKPVAVSATIGKFKVTAQTATLFQALRLESTDLVLDAGYATISDVSIKGTNNFYVVEKGLAGWTIRYADEFNGFGGKWKANDSVTLNVKVEGGANKLYTVKLPIVNIEKRADD